MQLALILAVVATFLLADAGPAEPVSEGPFRTLLVICSMSVTPLLAWGGSVAIARGVTLAGYASARWRMKFSRLKQILMVIWLALGIGASYFAGWAQIVRYNWGFAGWFVVDELLLLAPVVVPLVLCWAAYFEVERALQILAWQYAEAPVMRPRRGRFLGLQARHYFGLCLAPVLAVVVLQDFATLVLPADRVDALGWLVYGPALMALLVCFPWLLRYVWHTSPLPQGELRKELQAQAFAARLPVRGIYVWQTDGHMLNAAVAGFVPRLRYVFLTDGLLRYLSAEQIGAAFAHELGHIKFRHLWLRLLVLLAPALPYWTLTRHQPQAVASAADFLAAWGWATPWQAAILVPLSALLYAFVALGWYSRLLEHEADLWAAELATGQTQTGFQLEHFIAALERLAQVSGLDRRKTSWLHPSIEKRIAFLRGAAAEPERAARFQARLRRLPPLWVTGAMLASFGLWLWP